MLKCIGRKLSIKHQLLPQFCQNISYFPSFQFVFRKEWMRTNRRYDPVITTRKFTLSLREMSKRKSVENQMSGKRGKITRNQEKSVSLLKGGLSPHTLPCAIRSAVRSRNVKLVGSFEITSSRGGLQACENSYRLRNTIYYKNQGRYSRVYISFLVGKE